MAVSDPVADFLTSVRNAIRAKQRKVDVPLSRLKTEIAKVLLKERYINNFKVVEGEARDKLRVYLRYAGVSTPGRRVYVGKTQLPKVMGGMGTTVVSTSRGLMTDREARDAGLGGEVVLQVW
ncbi:MAG: 30S ribosomal protein S8 [Candidatus Eisenbacteria bacterium]|uniref:Small ribosomal subunit protein uS8 n=1 Tax=Eiseniibacteriota bacterium TaxID=2212470 RepID=A0A538U0J8_UNCEI|nr:MAG: 30S ribosomal protein S8 [Candidatus Eisenbacteria bacterium]